MKRYRFFYHYNKRYDCMTVHFRGICHIVDSVECMVPCYTKRNKEQPRIVMEGRATTVAIAPGMKTATIMNLNESA